VAGASLQLRGRGEHRPSAWAGETLTVSSAAGGTELLRDFPERQKRELKSQVCANRARGYKPEQRPSQKDHSRSLPMSLYRKDIEQWEMQSLGSNPKIRIAVPEYCSGVMAAVKFLGVLLIGRRGFLVSNCL